MVQYTHMNRTIGIIILVVIAVIAAAAALIVYNRGNLTPEAVASRFYGEWIKTRRTGDPIERGLHRESTYVTRPLGTTITAQREKQQGFDPVLCSSTVPDGFRVVPVTVGLTSTSTRTRVTVELMYPDEQKNVDVFIIKDGSWWRIDEIDCPVPAAA